MADLLELRSQLLDVHEELASIERALAGVPVDASDVSLDLTIDSLRKRHQSLETQYIEEADRLGSEICAYRVFSDDEQPKAAAVARALDTFQTLVSAMYGVILSDKPRNRGRISEAALSQSSLEIGYAFSGSFGLVLTVPNQRLLIGESALDRSMQLVFEMAESRTSAEIAKHAEQLGAAPIRALYKWSDAHVEGGIGADIEWRRAANVKASVYLSVPNLDQLRAAIEETGEPQEEHEQLSAILVAIHTETRTFVLALEDGAHIRGSLSDDFSLDDPVRLPLRYTASLTKVTKTTFATEQDTVKWILDDLEPV